MLGVSFTEIDEYGSKEIIINKVEFLDKNGNETKILYSLESFQIVIEYSAKVPIHNPTFVFCIYLASGATASQWLVSTKELGTQFIEGKGRFIFKGEKLFLGRGSYVASTAIFKWYPQKGLEPEAYHVLDRCTHFQIVNPDETELIDYGICRQPVSSEIITL